MSSEPHLEWFDVMAMEQVRTATAKLQAELDEVAASRSRLLAALERIAHGKVPVASQWTGTSLGGSSQVGLDYAAFARSVVAAEMDRASIGKEQT